jgi:mobilization protein MobC
MGTDRGARSRVSLAACQVCSVSLGHFPRARRNRIEDRFILELGRIGNNLNQVVRLAHRTGKLPAHDELHQVLDEILAAIRRIG